MISYNAENLHAPSANMSASYFDGYLHAAFVTVPAKQLILFSLASLPLSPGESNDELLGIVGLELGQGCHANLPSRRSSVHNLQLSGQISIGRNSSLCATTIPRRPTVASVVSAFFAPTEDKQQQAQAGISPPCLGGCFGLPGKIVSVVFMKRCRHRMKNSSVLQRTQL